MKYPETARRASAMALSVFLLVVGLVRETVSQTASSSSPPADEQPIMLNQSWELAPAEILRLKEDALNGSGEAAQRLWEFYAGIALDMPESEYWVTIEAEDGSVLGMYSLAQYLRDKGDPACTIRARWWFERVVKSGQQPLADAAAKRLKDMTQYSAVLDETTPSDPLACR